MQNKITGIGISPGIAHGKVKIVRDKKTALEVTGGDIVVSPHFLPPLSSLARHGAGFIFTGGEADHGVSYLKEIWKPAILVTDVSQFSEGMEITIDGETGAIYEGAVSIDEYTHHEPLKHDLKTKIYLQQSVPWMADKAQKLNTNGVGLLRTNLLVEEEAKHPYYYYVKEGKFDDLVTLIADGIEKIAATFALQPVWVRTMDFATDELRLFEGGEHEPHEENPLLGWRGLVRALSQRELLDADILALKRVVEKGYTNVGVIFPLVRDVLEYRDAKQRMRELGLVPHKDIKVGSMFETPSSALQIDEFIGAGLDLAFLGINDVTMYTLVSDRTNSNMRKSYNPANPAILNLFYNVLEKCKREGIETTTSFLTPLKPHLATFLEKGLTSLTLQADRINEVGEIVKKAEAELETK